MNITRINNDIIFSGKCPNALHVSEYITKTTENIIFKDFDTSETTDMSAMFENCRNWISIQGLETFNTSKVVDMSYMFNGCRPRGLLKCWSAPNILNTVNTLHGLDSFDTSNVINMKNMFRDCSVFIDTEINTWNVRNVKNMNEMFAYLYHLETISLPDWETPNLETCNGMFKECYVLHTVILTNFGCSEHLKDVSYMLNASESLTMIVMPKLYITKDTNMDEFVEMYHGEEKYSNFDIDDTLD